MFLVIVLKKKKKTLGVIRSCANNRQNKTGLGTLHQTRIPGVFSGYHNFFLIDCPSQALDRGAAHSQSCVPKISGPQPFLCNGPVYV